jgi:hypothetical protein
MATQVDSRLTEQLSSIAKQMADGAESAITGRAKPWMIGTWQGDPLDIVTLGDGFNRQAIIDAYTAAVSKPDEVRSGELSNLRTQYEIMMSAERAFRLRHATSVRCEMFATGRQRGMGNNGLKRITIDYLQSMLRTAQE